MSRTMNPNNTNDPATKKQCWALFCCHGKQEGKSYRDYVAMSENGTLTKGQAHAMLSEQSSNKAKASKDNFDELWSRAKAAGIAAGENAIPRPMVVMEHDNPLDDNSPIKQAWHVSEGACGFAWVNVKPGTSRFAKWLKANNYARTDSYAGGVTIWISEHNQSITRKEAHASALAKVLQEAGINAYASSRLD